MNEEMEEQVKEWMKKQRKKWMNKFSKGLDIQLHSKLTRG